MRTIGLSVVFVLAFVACSSRVEWLGLENQLYGHVQDYTHARQAGDLSGALSARTKIAADCDEAGSLKPSGSAEEQAVRSHCADYGFPTSGGR